jgi:hypothetical protein
VLSAFEIVGFEVEKYPQPDSFPDIAIFYIQQILIVFKFTKLRI